MFSFEITFCCRYIKGRSRCHRQMKGFGRILCITIIYIANTILFATLLMMMSTETGHAAKKLTFCLTMISFVLSAKLKKLSAHSHAEQNYALYKTFL